MQTIKTSLQNFEHASQATKPQVQAIKAMLLLGLTDQALAALPVSSDGMHPEADLEALRLACLDQQHTPSATLAEAALRALNHRPFAFGTYLLAITHLLHQGRHLEMLDLEKQCRRSHLGFVGEATILLACAATRLADFSTALHLLTYHYDGTLPAGHLMAESRLQPFWEHYARTRPDPTEARQMLSGWAQPEIDAAARPEFRGQIRDFDHAHHVPLSMRPWLERHLGGFWTLRPDTKSEQRLHFHQWNRTRIDLTLQLARQALDRAEIVRRTTDEPLVPEPPPPVPPQARTPEDEERKRQIVEELCAAIDEELLDQAEEAAPVVLGRSHRHRE